MRNGDVHLRKLRTGAWLRRVVVTSAVVAVAVALFSWMWMHVAVRNFPAESAVVSGEVVEFSRAAITSTGN